MKRVLLCLMLFVSLVSVAAPSHATAEAEAEDGKGASGLPVPRFASLRSDEVNMRTGPGTRYPIEWVLTRQGLPVEITAEYDIWRRVKDPDGSEGWVHKSALSGRRGAIVIGQPRELRDGGSRDGGIVAHLELGAIGQILSCGRDWCRLKFKDVKGYLPKDEFWGAYAPETFD